MKRVFQACIAASVLLLAGLSTGANAQNVVVNGDFPAGLTGWQFAPSTTGSSAGTCSYNAGPTPGTETLTGTSGFTTANPNQALGSMSLTANGFRSCVLYQDIAIPAGATTVTLSGDFGIKLLGGLSSGDTAIFAGLYPTTSVPSFNLSTTLGSTQRLIIGGASASNALNPQTSVVWNATSFQGTTVRLAIISAMQSPSSGTGAFIPGAGPVIGVSNLSVQAIVPAAPVPTMSEWAMILFGLILAGGAALYIQRRQSIA